MPDMPYVVYSSMIKSFENIPCLSHCCMDRRTEQISQLQTGTWVGKGGVAGESVPVEWRARAGWRGMSWSGARACVS